MSAFEECLHDWRDDGTCAHCIAVSGKVAMTYSALLNERTARLDECEMQLADTKRLLDLRERQLADCARAMREVSGELHTHGDWLWKEPECNLDWLAEDLEALAKKLDAARAVKAGA